MNSLCKKISIFMLFMSGNFLFINGVYPYDIEGIIKTEFENFDYSFPSESFVNINSRLKSAVIEPDGYFIFHNIPAGQYTLTVIVPGFKNKETEINVPLTESLNIILELPVEELEPIIITAKKEEWEETLEKLLKHDPNSDDSEADNFNNNNIYQEDDEAGSGGMPLLSPIFMLIKWLKENF